MWLPTVHPSVTRVPLVSWITPANVAEGGLLLPSLQVMRLAKVTAVLVIANLAVVLQACLVLWWLQPDTFYRMKHLFFHTSEGFSSVQEEANPQTQAKELEKQEIINRLRKNKQGV